MNKHTERTEARKNRSERNEKAALDAFVRRTVEITRMAYELAGIAEDHFDLDPENVTWANVGDVQRTLDALKEILAVIRGEVK